MRLITYEELLSLAVRAKGAGINLVFVFRPDVRVNAEEEDYPDMIISSSDSPTVIAALLGNAEPEEKE